MIYDSEREREMSGSRYCENLEHMQWESVHMITKKEEPVAKNRPWETLWEALQRI